MLFTIITVTYNSAAFVKQTIDSVLAQEYPDFEFIIGDDCSSDNTWEIIESFSDKKIRKYRNEVNLGEYANRTKALHQALGKYVIFIDGDDVMYEHALQTFYSYTASFPECAMFFCGDWDPRILCPYKVDPVTIYRFEYLDKGIIGGNFTKVLFKTEIIKNYVFPLGIRTGDTYIQLKIAQKYPGVVIPAGLNWWRRRKAGASQQLFMDHRHLAESFQYRLELLSGDCPLPEAEMYQAKINIYGIYLRILIRLIFSAKIEDVVYLLKKVKIPRKYYFAIFRRSNHNYYSHVSGENPLHSELSVKPTFINIKN